MNDKENMEMLMYGSISLSYLTYYPLLLLLKERYSVCTEVYPQVLKHLIKLEISIEIKKCRMRVRCEISFGQILTKELDGVLVQEEQDIHSDKIFLNNLIKQIV